MWSGTTLSIFIVKRPFFKDAPNTSRSSARVNFNLKALFAIPLCKVSVLSIDYHFGKKEKTKTLYDEYIADRYYKLGAAGFSIFGLGIFGLFAIQDFSNWSLQAANEFILNLSSFLWFVFGALIVVFSYGDYKESVDG